MYQRNLNNAFCSSCGSGVSYTDWLHCRSSAPSSTITTQPPDTKAAVSNPRVLVKLNGQYPVFSTRNMPSRSERNGDTAQISRTPEEAPGTGGTTIASATRAHSPRMATSSRRYNNPLTHLATGATQGLKAKLYVAEPIRLNYSGSNALVITV
jgi:hypothetical protein